MAQAGIHSLLGIVVRNWSPARKWLPLGIVLGNLFPDTDNLAVAIATLLKLPSDGLHRTFTHSLFTILLIMAVFAIAAGVTRKPRWNNLGIGLGIGILMHILVDLAIWFNGVALLWPIPSWLNFWSGMVPPVWFDQLMLPVEFLFFALFFISLASMARRQATDQAFLSRLKIYSVVEIVLFAIFTGLVYGMKAGFMTIYGLVYLISLGLAVGITIRMRQTIEAGITSSQKSTAHQAYPF